MDKQYDRFIETQIKDIFEEFPALAIDGLKAIGKTVSSKRIARTVYELDRTRDLEFIENDIERLSSDEKPVLIDEWKNVPSTWDYVRRAVDDGAPAGSYLLTGSTSDSDVNVHSGAGRILRLRMFPLSLAERALVTPSVSLRTLLQSNTPFSTHIQGESGLTFSDYIHEIISSGLPEIRQYSDARRPKMFKSYIDNMLSHEFKQQGVTIRQPTTLRRWLTSYAAATATDASYSEILDAGTAGISDKPAYKTTISYREALTNLWMLDEIPPWIEGENYFSRLKQTPKHYLADPAISAHLLGLNTSILSGRDKVTNKIQTVFDKKYGSITGRLFESLMQLSLRVYAEANDAQLYFLRTYDGSHEIDFILQQDDKVIAIEVKLSISITNEDVTHLQWLRSQMGERLTDALIITTGPLAYRRSDGIIVVPAGLLTA